VTGLVCGAALFASACQEASDRPAGIDSCGADAGCRPVSPIFGGGGVRRDGGGGSSDAGQGVELVGSVVSLADDLRTGVPFTERASVVAEATKGGFVSGTYNGLDEFRLPGVLVSPMTWAGVEPSEARGLALPTLLALDTEASAEAVMALVSADTLDLIYQTVSLPVTRQPGYGQVIVFFVHDDAVRSPAAGISADITGAEAVLYDDGAGSFTDTTTVTGRGGIAVLANVVAQEFPGTKHKLVWAGAASGFEEILIAADSVTFVGFRVKT
jgi:hypothetical protein